MSRYLIDRITALPNVVLHSRTEVVGLSGRPGGALAAATFRDRRSGEETSYPLRHLFLFIGAEPNTDWLEGCDVVVDSKGFVLTGEAPERRPPAAPDLRRSSLETAVAGVFAIGDVRSGSVKRVAAAVDEGAAVVAQVHAYLNAVTTEWPARRRTR